jgi:hypothetical protein
MYLLHFAAIVLTISISKQKFPAPDSHLLFNL